jgi:hypothetical protein
MNATTPSSPPRADQVDLDEAVGLLGLALAEIPIDAQATPGALRERLLGRVAASAARHQGMLTTRRRQGQAIELAPGATQRWLYRAVDPTALRPGEPLALAIVELAPGVRLAGGMALAVCSSEWLTLRGSVSIDGVALEALGHHGRGATAGEPVVVAGTEGATLYVRNGGNAPTPAGTTHERDAVWEDYAPGIRRRVLWQQGGACAYLARAVEGALVPSHGHHHDEESLMLEGDLFLGDILIREGDFQLAPAGRVHGTVQAGSDCVVYIRGDAELAFDLGDPNT